MHRAYLGLGSNQGDPVRRIRSAIRMLRHHPAVRIVRVSRLYRSEPVGHRDQPWFVNTACVIDTELAPQDLAAVLRRIESALGKAVAFPNGPRTIDLDLLMFDDQQFSSPDLIIPHPRFRERRFVLVPLAEAAPDAVDPVSGRKIADLLRRCPDRSAVEPA